MIGKDIVAVVSALTDRRLVWEPFCGGLGTAEPFAKAGWTQILTDVHPALISLYRAAVAGWDPPRVVTREEYQRSRKLPDSDPMKAFVGFGCSFGGKYFGGYAPNRPEQDYAGGSRNVVLRQCAACASAEFWCADFLASIPGSIDRVVIYADPPYAETQGYACGRFDSAGFWDKCRAWAASGADVFVSEYQAPPDVPEIWRKDRLMGLGLDRGGTKRVRTERLFRIQPGT